MVILCLSAKDVAEHMTGFTSDPAIHRYPVCGCLSTFAGTHLSGRAIGYTVSIGSREEPNNQVRFSFFHRRAGSVMLTLG